MNKLKYLNKKSCDNRQMIECPECGYPTEICNGMLNEKLTVFSACGNCHKGFDILNIVRNAERNYE